MNWIDQALENYWNSPRPWIVLAGLLCSCTFFLILGILVLRVLLRLGRKDDPKDR
jgi:hypothetical protein